VIAAVQHVLSVGGIDTTETCVQWLVSNWKSFTPELIARIRWLVEEKQQRERLINPLYCTRRYTAWQSLPPQWIHTCKDS